MMLVGFRVSTIVLAGKAIAEGKVKLAKLYSKWSLIAGIVIPCIYDLIIRFNMEGIIGLFTDHEDLKEECR